MHISSYLPDIQDVGLSGTSLLRFKQQCLPDLCKPLQDPIGTPTQIIEELLKLSPQLYQCL